MTVSKLVQQADGWTRFNLNVGGFTIKNCRWHPQRRAIRFPVRYDRGGRRHNVIRAWGTHVIRLRELLESGQTASKRDRRRCEFRIRPVGLSRERYGLINWLIFNFTVRGFTTLGCRWQPETGSVQLPVTFFPQSGRRVKKRVVCAWGAHIKRLQQALQQQVRDHYDDLVSVYEYRYRE